jgi:hypothetical protein
MTIRAFRNNLQALDIQTVSVQSIEQTKEYYADLNAEQLNKGRKQDGSLMPDYSLRSVIQFNKPAGPIKLYDTGAFYKGLKLDVNGVKLSVYSTDSKSDMLESKYGTEIFGLSIPFKREYIKDALQPEFIKRVKDILRL